MKIIMQKTFLISCVFIGLNLCNIDVVNCSLGNIAYEDSNKATTFNSHNQVYLKESSLPLKKTKQTNRPNVLLIGIETLRADHVGCLGYPRNTTPTLDKLAKEGVVCSSAIATSSWTMPTCMSVFTSLYPGIHKTTDYRKKLPEEITTLADILKENGYVTVAFVSNPLLDNRYGFSKGFDLYDDFTVQLSLSLNLFGKNDKIVRDLLHSSIANEAVQRPAISWLQKNHHKQFFMFVFYFDPHVDYTPPPPFDTIFDPNYEGLIDGCGITLEPLKNTRPPKRDLEHIIALYDGEILYTDSYISDLIEEFKRLGILDETLIIIFGDHGDEFYEHGSTTHGLTLYNEVIHIPLILRWPCEIPQNKRISALVSQVDIMPTTLDYLDINYAGFTQGSSLRPLIEGRQGKLHDVVYAELSINENTRFVAGLSGQDKLILDLNSNEKQFFKRDSNPFEQINSYTKASAKKLITMEKDLIQWLVDNDKMAKQIYGNKGEHHIDLDENNLKQLKTLGYVR